MTEIKNKVEKDDQIPNYQEPNWNQQKFDIGSYTITQGSQLVWKTPGAFTQFDGSYQTSYDIIHDIHGNKKSFKFSVFPVAMYWKCIGVTHISGTVNFNGSLRRGITRTSKIAFSAKNQVNTTLKDLQNIKLSYGTGFPADKKEITEEQDLEYSSSVTNQNCYIYQKQILYAHRTTNINGHGGIPTDDYVQVLRQNEGFYQVEFGLQDNSLYMFTALACEPFFVNPVDNPYQEITENEVIGSLLSDKYKYRLHQM